MNLHPVLGFLLFWAVNTLSLWVADELFAGIALDSVRALFISSLLLGLANAFVRPIVLVLTLPITVVSFGLFILVVNALMLLLVAWAVPGLHVAGFWSGALIALFVSILSFLINRALGVNLVVVRRER